MPNNSVMGVEMTDIAADFSQQCETDEVDRET